MTIYNLYIYSRGGNVLFTRRWNQRAVSEKFLVHQQKLLWGLLFSMKDLVGQIAVNKSVANRHSAGIGTHNSPEQPNSSLPVHVSFIFFLMYV